MADVRAFLRPEDSPPLETTKATIHENSIPLHFPDGPTVGPLVILDRDVGQRLAGFVARCDSIFHPSVEQSQSFEPTD